MPAKVKTVVAWLVAAFLVYAVVRDPAQAAAVLRSLWDGVLGILDGFGKFFNNLVG